MRPTDTIVSISAALELQFQTRPDNICMIFLPGNEVAQEVTYRQLQAAVYHYARVLHAQAIVPGDLVALVFNHTWELIPAFLGAIHLGAVPVILPYLNTISGERLEKQVKQMIAAWQVSAVVTLPHYLPAFGFLETAGCPIVALPAPNETGVEAVPVCGRGGDETAYLQLSSGTTGEPKATIIPHRALLNSIQTMIEAWSLTEQDVSVGWLPLHHDMGLIFQVLTPLLGGFLSVLIAPDYWVRRPRSLMQAVHRYRGTWTGMPNFAFNHCVHAIRESDMTGLDLSSWRLLLNGAELIYLNSLQIFYDRFAPYGLRHECLRAVYGMTENVGAISLTTPVSATEPWLVDWVATADLVDGGSARPKPPHHPKARPIVNCGRLLPGNELKIVSADGSVLPERRVGEVCLRSHSLCPAYYRLENGHIPQADGWFSTGDIGYLANGELFICDRKKDIIISAGNHIFPGVIESAGVEVLGDRAGGMAAFGVSSAELGTELPVLVCEVRGKVDESEQIGWIAAIRRQVHRELGITPADIRLVRRGWLAQTTSAKIARAACRQKYLAEFAPAGLVAGIQIRATRPPLDTPFIAPRTELERQIAEIWAELLDLNEVGVEDNFFDLGGDSLSAMRMLLQVEQMIGSVDATVFFQKPTVTTLFGMESDPVTGPIPSGSGAGPADEANRRRGLKGGLLGPLKLFLKQGPVWRGHALPYGVGVQLQRLVIFSGLGQKLYARQLEFVRQCQAEIGTPAESQIYAVSLLANTWSDWRNLALKKPGVAERRITITGEGKSLFDQAEPSYGMVLVLPHAGRIISPLENMIRLCGRATARVTNDRTIKHTGNRVARSRLQTQSRAAQLWQAQQVLRRNGVVFIAGDGLQGKQSVDVPFWGRKRPFQIGAAELAIETGSLFVPAFVLFDRQGRIEIEVLDPLIPPVGTAMAQVNGLTRQYGELYAARWPQFYASMNWHHLKYNLNLPYIHL